MTVFVDREVVFIRCGGNPLVHREDFRDCIPSRHRIRVRCEDADKRPQLRRQLPFGAHTLGDPAVAERRSTCGITGGPDARRFSSADTAGDQQSPDDVVSLAQSSIESLPRVAHLHASPGKHKMARHSDHAETEKKQQENQRE